MPVIDQSSNIKKFVLRPAQNGFQAHFSPALPTDFNRVYLSQNLLGFRLTTQKQAAMTESAMEMEMQRQMARAPLAERDPLLAAVRGRLDGKSLKDYDSQAFKELSKIHGRGLFKGKDKGGMPLDLLADELVRGGLLPEGSGANELLAALQDRKQYFQPSLEEIRSGDEALRQDSAAWGKSVDAFISGTLPARQPATMLKQTPLVLQMLGAKNLPVKTTYGALKKVLVDKHKLPAETVKQVPAAMADPVMVFKSATQAGDLVMMLELKDQNGATVVVPVALEQNIPGNYTVNLATSIYGKGNVKTGVPSNKWFTDQIQDGNLVYQNKKKSRSWAAMVGLQLPPMRPPSSAKQNIHTDADLVKLREQNPTYYQNERTPGAVGADYFSDSRYFTAIESGDMETAQRIIDEQARKKGYVSTEDYRMNHRAPNKNNGDINLESIKKSGIVPDDYWTHPNYYQSDAEELRSFYKIVEALDKQERFSKKTDSLGKHLGASIFMYRAVPKNVKEENFRNGDWITPSKEYAKMEGESIPGGYRIIKKNVKIKNVWWDGNSINEFGYDDGNNYAYKNTKNNKKLFDVITYDYENNIVAPSKRFNARASEVFYQGNVDSDGQTLNASSTRGPRGSIDFSNPQAVINLFKGKANFSTVIHELGHFFLENLREATQLDTALAACQYAATRISSAPATRRGRRITPRPPHLSFITTFCRTGFEHARDSLPHPSRGSGI